MISSSSRQSRHHRTTKIWVSSRKSSSNNDDDNGSSSAPSLSATVESFVVKTLFGGLDKNKDNVNNSQKTVLEEQNKVLLEMTRLEVSKDQSSILQAQTSLKRYLTDFAFLLEDDKTLSTPITSTNKPLLRDISTYNNNTSILQTEYVRIMFRPPPRRLSFNEQKDLEKGVLPDRKGAKMDSKSPGGIQLLLQAERIEGSDNFQLNLVAQRCGIDNDTVIKEASERTIIRRLNDAIRIWRKVRTM